MKLIVKQISIMNEGNVLFTMPSKNYEFMSNNINIILGRSGSGKTLILESLSGIYKINKDNIVFIDENNNSFSVSPYFSSKDKKTVYVNQSYTLIEHWNVIDNIIKPIKIMKKLKNKDLEIIKKDAFRLLEYFEIDYKAYSYQKDLSGGEKQIVAILRSIFLFGDILLFDEPTSALDQYLINKFSYLMFKISNLSNIVILITHNYNFIKTLIDENSDRVKIFNFDGKNLEKLSNDNSVNLLKKMNKIENYCDTETGSKFNSNCILAEIQNNWVNQFNNLLLFTNKKNRLPSIFSKDKEERLLSQWVQKQRDNKILLEKKQKQAFNDINGWYWKGERETLDIILKKNITNY